MREGWEGSSEGWERVGRGVVKGERGLGGE